MVAIPRLLWAMKLLEKVLSIGEKNGSKRHLLVDENGIPLSLLITEGNKHDVKEMYNLIDIRKLNYKRSILVDKGYKSEALHKKIKQDFNIEIVMANKGKRWIVEVCHSWFNNFRKLKVRYEKTTSSFLGLHCIAASLIIFRRIMII
jgi:transposase